MWTWFALYTCVQLSWEFKWFFLQEILLQISAIFPWLQKKNQQQKNHNICKGHEWWCIQTRNLLKARFQLICLVWELTDRDAEMIFTFGGQWQPMLRGSFAVTWFTLTVGLLWPFSYACLIARLGELRGATQKFKWSAQGLVFCPLPNSPRVYTIWRYIPEVGNNARYCLSDFTHLDLVRSALLKMEARTLFYIISQSTFWDIWYRQRTFGLSQSNVKLVNPWSGQSSLWYSL